VAEGTRQKVRSITHLPASFFLPIQRQSLLTIILPNTLNMDNANGFTSVNGHGNGHISPPTAPIITSTVGTKRKRDPKSAAKFYAVRIGKTPGVYHSWADCLEQVRGFPKAAFKSFTTLTDAEAFVKNESASGGGAGGSSGSGKFYGVQSGRNPGVYSSWPEVLEQITGWRAPKHKVFKTRIEAEMFVAEGQQVNGDGNGDGTMESIEMADGTPSKKIKTGKAKKGGKDDGDGYGLVGEEYEPGDGPLPEDAEDNFDHTITLDQSTGTARYKTAAELGRTKYAASAPVKDAPVRIYTDGSALNNGQAAAIGGVGVYFGPLDKRNVSEPLSGSKQTNQRAELTAILRALEVAPRDRRIIIFSDSKYAINCVTEWFLKWREKNWINSSNKSVENKDLIQKILEMLEERYRLNHHRIVDYEDEDVDDEGEPRGHWDKGPGSVKFVWVKGHAKDEGNNAADELAVNGARVARELGEDIELD
jgi:ribonuclease HI